MSPTGAPGLLLCAAWRSAAAPAASDAPGLPRGTRVPYSISCSSTAAAVILPALNSMCACRACCAFFPAGWGILCCSLGTVPLTIGKMRWQGYWALQRLVLVCGAGLQACTHAGLPLANRPAGSFCGQIGAVFLGSRPCMQLNRLQCSCPCIRFSYVACVFHACLICHTRLCPARPAPAAAGRWRYTRRAAVDRPVGGCCGHATPAR